MVRRSEPRMAAAPGFPRRASGRPPAPAAWCRVWWTAGCGLRWASRAASVSAIQDGMTGAVGSVRGLVGRATGGERGTVLRSSQGPGEGQGAVHTGVRHDGHHRVAKDGRRRRATSAGEPGIFQQHAAVEDELDRARPDGPAGGRRRRHRWPACPRPSARSAGPADRAGARRERRPPPAPAISDLPGLHRPVDQILRRGQAECVQDQAPSRGQLARSVGGRRQFAQRPQPDVARAAAIADHMAAPADFRRAAVRRKSETAGPGAAQDQAPGPPPARPVALPPAPSASRRWPGTGPREIPGPPRAGSDRGRPRSAHRPARWPPPPTGSPAPAAAPPPPAAARSIRGRTSAGHSTARVQNRSAPGDAASRQRHGRARAAPFHARGRRDR